MVVCSLNECGVWASRMHLRYLCQFKASLPLYNCTSYFQSMNVNFVRNIRKYLILIVGGVIAGS